MYKNKKNLLGLGAGLSFAFMAFFAPSVAMADTEADATTETLSTAYTTYEVSVDADGNITLTGTSESYDVTVATGETSVTGTLTDGTYEGVYYGNLVSSSSFGGGLTSPESGSTISADFVGNKSAASSVALRAGALLVLTNSIAGIDGDFIGNSVVRSGSANNNAMGGAIVLANSITSDGIVGNFYGNSVTANSKASAAVYGGAIYVNASITGGITGDFSNNYATTTGTTGTAMGGAIYTASTIDFIEGNFYNNYVGSVSSTKARGGAVYATSGSSTTFQASNGNSYYYLGNFASNSSIKSDEYGGFLYMEDGATVEFATDTDSSITIGYTTTSSAYAEDYDSIAGAGSITKTGAGTLTVNSSMEYYTGSLTVTAGSMVVNNTLSASSISVTGGSLEVSVLNVYLSDALTSSIINLSGDASLTVDTLAIYLDGFTGESFEVYSESDAIITKDVVAYYADDSGVYVELSSENYTFTNGTFSYTTAVPEPSTYAMIFGVIALGFAYYRRRK